MKQLTAEQIALLRRPLPAEAKKKHPTKAYLTTINSIFVTERLNDVFGTGSWQVRSEIVSNTTKMVVVKTTLTIPEYDIYYECYGGNDNADTGDAHKGAVTDAITKIGSWLGIGAEVWKNHPEIVPPQAPAQVTAPQPRKGNRRVINDALLDNPERCNNLINFLQAAYEQNPQSFAVIRHLQDLGFTFEDCADRRLTDIWMQHIENKGL